MRYQEWHDRQAAEADERTYADRMARFVPPVLTAEDIAVAMECQKDLAKQESQRTCSELDTRPGFEILTGRAETLGGDV